ncbi:fructose-6-phosphate aldolase [Candidatus Fermentibacteria bacterium]|nr:fructose-6-phosphate aldolase [Candidatus Fermentibacteria bacterium]
MKFFLDTAHVPDIRKAAGMGIADGVTTNPSLVAKEGRDFIPLVREICAIVDGPVSAEVTAEDADGMVRQGRDLAGIAGNVIIKVPFGQEGLQAVRALEAEKIATNVTLVFSPLQALLAARAGASYISPFIGRLDDVGHRGMDVVEQALDVLANYDLHSQIIVASIRHPLHVLEAALIGAPIVTVPPAVLWKLFDHPLTDIGVARFKADWQGLQEKLR